jgi:hypothetical protein
MPDYLVGLLTSSAVFSAVIAMVNHWYKERLSSAIKHEYDLRMLAMQNQNAKAMEEIRTELKIQELKTQVRFSALHAERARAIKLIHENIVPLVQVFRKIVAACESDPKTVGSYMDDFLSRRNQFASCFANDRIYFHPRLGEDLGSIGEYMSWAVISRLGDTEDGNNVLDLPPMKDFANLGELLVEAVENEFREILGVVNPGEADVIRLKNTDSRDAIKATPLWKQRA